MADADLSAAWIDAGREPKSPPNPAYPDGIDLDVSNGAERSCGRLLPHPAKRCGTYLVWCGHCGAKVAVTTAGRPDDPRSIRIACKDSRDA